MAGVRLMSYVFIDPIFRIIPNEFTVKMGSEYDA